MSSRASSTGGPVGVMSFLIVLGLVCAIACFALALAREKVEYGALMGSATFRLTATKSP